MQLTSRPVRRDRRGVAMVEFAFMLPLAMLMMFGVADLVQLGRGHLRAQSAATQIGQIISQCKQVGAADEAKLAALTGRILGSFAENNAQWRLIITAFGRDNTDGTAVNITWTIDQSPSGPAQLSVTQKGSAVPANYTFGCNKLLFRTEVFASIDRTQLTRLTSLLAGKVTLGFDKVSAEAVQSTRVGNTDTLKTKTSSTGCLT
jgi:Flp pilus assembly protein TadG